MDKDLFTSAFTSLQGRLQRVALRIVGNSDDAADAVQETFCRLWTRRDSIDSEQQLTGAAVTTVHNLGIDTLRQRKARGYDQIDDNIANNESPEQPPNTEQQLQEVQAIIAKQLTPMQQRIIELREWDGEEFSEIARRLGTSETNVRVQLSRARKTIREIYRQRQTKI